MIALKPYQWMECFRCGHKWPKGQSVSYKTADCCRNPLLYLMANEKDKGKKVAE